MSGFDSAMLPYISETLKLRCLRGSGSPTTCDFRPHSCIFFACGRFFHVREKCFQVISVIEQSGILPLAMSCKRRQHREIGEAVEDEPVC